MTQLRKRLTLYGLTMIAVGSCIGSGIFITPYQIVGALPHAGWVLVVWAIGGLIALTGALTFSELSTLFPKAGGVYVFLKEAYGDWVGFLYGWIILLVVNTGALAALSVGFAEYLKFFIPEITDFQKTWIAITVIGGLTLINCVGVQLSQIFATIFTGLKILAIGFIVVIGFVYFEPSKVEVSFALTENVPTDLGGALLIALVGVLWSFGGWHHATYLSGETIQPQRTVPRAMVLGALIVTTVYLLVNLAYMLLLPLDAIAQTERVAGDAMEAVFSWGGKFVTIVIAVSIFGTIGIYTMSAPRIYFAMAKDGIFFKRLTYLHPKWQTPVFAMVLQAVWAIVLLLFWKTFHDLISYVTFMDIIFMALAGISVFVFRKKLPNQDRLYKVIGYPVVPLIFVGISVAFVINTLIKLPLQAGAGLLVLAIGSGIYFIFKRANSKNAHENIE